MIIEIDDKTGTVNSFKTMDHFMHSHPEVTEQIKDSIKKSKIEVNIWNEDLLHGLLPDGTSKICRIISHTNFLVIHCTDGEQHVLDRCAEYPFFKFNK